MKFKGFTDEQTYGLLTKLDYKGPMRKKEMDEFIAASPGVSAKMKAYHNAAEERLKKKGQPKFAAGGAVTGSKLTKIANNQAKAAVKDPTSLITEAEAATVQQSDDQFIAEGTGNAGDAPQAQASTVDNVQQASSVVQPETATVEANLVGDQANQILDEAQAATAQPSEAATVQGQLASLYADFDEGVPPWASGAMREATAGMNARGMGASSMAGQAIVTAAMEAALPIAMEDAKTVAAFEMQNLNNEQQMSVLKTQQRLSALFTDQAVENATAQFNATNENQANQFFSNLQSTVERFNAEQVNAVRMFNVDQENAIEQFNTGLQSAREEFNTSNDLVIAQANAAWRQNIATLESGYQHEVNMENARQATGMTMQALDHLWQRERDIMAFAFTEAENAGDRDLQLMLGDQAARSDTKTALGYLAGKVLGGISFF